MAYVSAGELLEGPLGEHGARVIGAGSSPFYRADGEWLAFVAGSAALWKVSLDGGAAEEIARFEPRFLGGTWRGDTIVFATNNGLFRVSAQGGEPELLIRPDDSTIYASPSFVSGATAILFTMIPSADVNAAQVAWLDLDSLTVTPIRRGTGARYLPAGFLVYAAGEGLETIAFDPETRQTSGAPVAVPGVELEVAEPYGNVDFAVSDTATLVTMSVAGEASPRKMVWVDPATGDQDDANVTPGLFNHPRISPDGTRVAVDEYVSGDRDIYVHDLENGTKTNVSVSPGEDLWPVWSSDGQRIYFGSTRSSAEAWSQIYSRRADGSGPTERLIDDPQVRIPWSVSGDQVLVFNGVRSRSDIGVLNGMAPENVDWLLANPAYTEETPSVLFGGGFILYASAESGELEVYVRPFPNVDDGRLQVSTGGGLQPLWGPEVDGVRQIFYRAPNDDVMLAEVDLSDVPPSIDSRRLLFPNRDYFGANVFNWSYDVSPIDGRFLMLQPVQPDQLAEATITVTLNWDQVLTRLVPTD
jgi:Tol biopolymer transport system component